MSNHVVLITGFGPFHGHNVNASWEAVKLVPSESIKEADVIVQEIPVIYNVVDSVVPQLWEKYNPSLVIHVGVSAEARKITIESQAHRTGYVRVDCTGKEHQTKEVCTVTEGLDCIKPGLDVGEICNFINRNTQIKACVSQNAGRYLCEYIFYKSLSIDFQKTLFIHVPPLDNPYTAEELATALRAIVRCALQQLNNKCNIGNTSN
ncbi:protease family c15 pyroglutamyl-peptidase i-related [Holotrichia oblita]|uniref:Protease family c15 pyroglutamyl-peptidase i-related n=1 Tax=Holotrichia oblita TaxID=644536 RepID=A0ACB9TJI4_HOLOL|nr:protease family c15 pyroglutamyl-peptidase i-related [Holotrichia oblita]